MRNWNRYGFYTYLLLPERYDPASLNAKLPAFIRRHNKQNTIKQSVSLEPLGEVYMKGKPRGGKGGSTATGNITNVYIFSVVAVFVLVIACFNFINLSTAFSLFRTKEIGVRKVLGASRRQLIFQFLTDAFLLCIIAFVLAIIWSVLLLPVFNQLAGKTVTISIFQQPIYLVVLFLVTLFIGLLSGIYPAFFISSFQPVSSLKGNASGSRAGGRLRQVLVVSQFSISIILIVATLIVYKQLYFMKNQELGFNKNHKLVIDFQYDQRILNHADAVKNQLTSIPGITSASLSSYIPGKPNRKFSTQIENAKGGKEEFLWDAYFIDQDFLKQYQIRLISGRGFSKAFPADVKSAMLVNEAAVKKLGYSSPHDVIGKRFSQDTKGAEGTIIGVIKNFHYRTYQEEIQPLTLRISPGFFTFLSLDISPKNLPGTISLLEKKWAELAPGLPMSYFFADETYDAQYKAEERFGRLFFCFTGLAILISCLGLLGLSAFSTIQRTKEIGIRKVLGASVGGIVTLLTKDFLKLILLALLIAAPISWLMMHNWLQNFAYRVDIELWMFAIAGLLALFIAIFTISFQAVKAAVVNPVESLRRE